MKYHICLICFIICSIARSNSQTNNDSIFYRPLHFEMTIGYHERMNSSNYEGQSFGMHTSNGEYGQIKLQYYINHKWSTYFSFGGNLAESHYEDKYPCFFPDPENRYIDEFHLNIPLRYHCYEIGTAYSLRKKKWEVRPALGISTLYYQSDSGSYVKVRSKEKGSNIVEYAGIYFNNSLPAIWAITPRITFLRHPNSTFSWIFDFACTLQVNKLPATYYRTNAYDISDSQLINGSSLTRKTHVRLGNIFNVSAGFAIKFGRLRKAHP